MAGMIYWNKQKKCHLSEATQPNQASTPSITVWFITSLWSIIHCVVYNHTVIIGYVCYTQHHSVVYYLTVKHHSWWSWHTCTFQRYDVMSDIMASFLISWRTFHTFYVLTYLLKSWRTFWHHDTLSITFYVMTYFLKLWHNLLCYYLQLMSWSTSLLCTFCTFRRTCWHYDILFDVMRYFLISRHTF